MTDPNLNQEKAEAEAEAEGHKPITIQDRRHAENWWQETRANIQDYEVQDIFKKMVDLYLTDALRRANQGLAYPGREEAVEELNGELDKFFVAVDIIEAGFNPEQKMNSELNWKTLKTLKEVARELSIPTKTLYSAARLGMFPAHQSGNIWLIQTNDPRFKKWLAARPGRSRVKASSNRA